MNNPDNFSKPPERSAGVCLHITSLPGPYGIGEIGVEARRFVDTMRHMKLSVWQFLPIGPTAYGNSPYQPLSTFAGNEMLIDIDNIIELGLLESSEVSSLTSLSHEFVDYSTLIPLKTRLLRLAAGRFTSTADIAIKQAYETFVSANNSAWLHDYSLFRVLKARHQDRPWIDWHPDFVHRNEHAMAEFESSAGDEIEAVKILQFLFFRQWSEFKNYANSNGVQLFGDLPIYIALDSADAWANPEILRIDDDGQPDRVAGVPPDYFSEDGQLWGNPLYDWEAHKADGYAWWVQRLQATSRLVDLVRIDHFRGFESFWSIPTDADTARSGQWEVGPGDEIFAAFKAAIGALPIVAEDLGLITPEVEALRDRHELPGMAVLQFMICDPEFDADKIPQNRICYTGTHDNDTTLGWFRGGDGDRRSGDEIRAGQEKVLQQTGGDEQTVSIDIIEMALSTRCKIAIAPLQDILGLGSDSRLNTPGTSSDNWRWRVRRDQLSNTHCDTIATMVQNSGRG